MREILKLSKYFMNYDYEPIKDFLDVILFFALVFWGIWEIDLFSGDTRTLKYESQYETDTGIVKQFTHNKFLINPEDQTVTSTLISPIYNGKYTVRNLFGATGSKEPYKSIEKTLDEAHFNLIRREESVQKLKNCRVQSLDDWTCEGFTVFGDFGKKTISITLQNGEWLINGIQSDDIFGWKISWFLKRNSFYGINPLSTKYKPCENDICFVDTLKNRKKRLKELKKKFFRADVRG